MNGVDGGYSYITGTSNTVEIMDCNCDNKSGFAGAIRPLYSYISIINNIMTNNSGAVVRLA